MGKMLAVICLMAISSTVFANENGPYVCACETISNTTAEYSQMIVTDLGTGKVFKLGKFVGGNFFRTKNDSQASTLCTQAISMQAVCTTGRAQQ
jgi:hypothetical protein